MIRFFIDNSELVGIDLPPLAVPGDLLRKPGVEGYWVIGVLCTRVSCKLSWRDASATAMRSHLVVVTPPVSDHVTCLSQRREPVLVQAFVAERAVEAFDVAVLHWAPRFDEKVLDAVLLRPGDKGAAGELGAIVRSHTARG